MHREAVTHLSVSTKTNFLMTASQDGHVKFWHKMDAGADTPAKPASGNHREFEILKNLYEIYATFYAFFIVSVCLIFESNHLLGAAEMDLLGSTSSSETSSKGQRGIEFVKHFRTHLAPIQDMQVGCDDARESCAESFLL